MERFIGLLVTAIQHRHVLSIYYEPGLRLIKPCAIGRSAEGNLLLRAYQIEGASASGEHAHWKLFRLDKMTKAEPSGGSFDGPPDGYKRGDRAMKGGIIAEL